VSLGTPSDLIHSYLVLRDGVNTALLCKIRPMTNSSRSISPVMREVFILAGLSAFIFLRTLFTTSARQSLSRFSRSQLTSTKILAQRSAVPAVFSRPLASAAKRKVGVARVDKDRLLRLAKRPRKGPFNAMLEPEPNVAEITEAVKHSGNYDPWAETDSDKDEIYGLEFVKKKAVKVSSVL
jgi:hypothetical protein